MIYRKPREGEWEAYERLALHPLQSKAWGDFRETTGVESFQLVGFESEKMVSQMQLTMHPIPHLKHYRVGYFPKGRWPDEVQLQALKELGQQQRTIFVKLEPNVSTPPQNEADIAGLQSFLEEHGCKQGRPLFTPHTFLIDLTKSEEQLLAAMKSKTRYNIGVAQRAGVKVVEDSTDTGFEDYMGLLTLTTKRQQFYAHGESYQRNMWKHMGGAGIAKILKAVYQDTVLAAWVLFVYKDTLYYPYGASSREHREVMASNLLMWEAMRYGKKIGMAGFDLWGALGSQVDQDDPWYGFHRFKEGYGGALATFVGSYDLVLDPQKYQIYRVADRWRWRMLRLRSRLPF
jgi:lipid II:glycine glycyltransferase (peptidoglycan interpeptide bridge formation enzyme)